MISREKKTNVELAALIMDEVRKNPDWSDILSASIIPQRRQASHHPNWDVAFTVNGQMAPPDRAYQIARDLQSRFDLG